MQCTADLTSRKLRASGEVETISQAFNQSRDNLVGLAPTYSICNHCPVCGISVIIGDICSIADEHKTVRSRGKVVAAQTYPGITRDGVLVDHHYFAAALVINLISGGVRTVAGV